MAAKRIGDSGEGCNITIVNKTGSALDLQTLPSIEGDWNPEPESTIPSGGSFLVGATGADATMTGYSISFKYTIADGGAGTWVEWQCSKPYDGNIKFAATLGGANIQYYTITNDPANVPKDDDNDIYNPTTTITKVTAPK